MLKFYLTEEQVPDGKQVLRDVEHEFGKIQIPFNEYSKRVVAEVDGGVLLSPTTYRSRFGPVISTAFLSTGCKAALIAPLVDGVLNLSEMGSNVLPLLFSSLKDGEFLYKPGCEGMQTYATAPAGKVLWGNWLCDDAQSILDAQRCLGEVL